MYDFVRVTVVLTVPLLVIDGDALGRIGELRRGDDTSAAGGIDASRLLHKDVLARLHGRFEMLRVQIRGRSDVDGIDIAGEKIVHVLEGAGAGELLGGGGELIVVDVAEGGDFRELVFTEEPAHVGAAAAAADEANGKGGVGLRAADGLWFQQQGNGGAHGKKAAPSDGRVHG